MGEYMEDKKWPGGIPEVPAPEYPGFENAELQNFAASQETLHQLPQTAASEERKETYIPPQPDAGVTGYYLNKRYSYILAGVWALFILLSIGGWTFGIEEMLRKNQVPAAQPAITQSVTVTASKTIMSILPASTVTQTSMATTAPTALPLMLVEQCWQLLNSICLNDTQIPEDDGGIYGDCYPAFRYFYCGLLPVLPNVVEVNAPGATFQYCDNMQGFCKAVNEGGAGIADSS
jgi:hypothetical protein